MPRSAWGQPMNSPANVARRRTVENGVLTGVSSSQIENYWEESDGGCPRKWYFQKVMRLEDRTDTGSRDLGGTVHGELEAYLKGGPRPKMDIIQPGLIYLPLPSPTLLVEAELVPPITVAGVPYTGKIDMLDPPRPDAPQEFWIGDHKTTKNFKYCKSSKQLSERNVQLLSYAYWGALRFWGPQAMWQGGYRVHVSHIYYNTQERAARRVNGVINTTDIPARWATITRVVESMKLDAAKSDPNAVATNPKACRAFGGCPYRNRCNVNDNKPTSLRGMFAPSTPRKSLPVAAPAQDAPPAAPEGPSVDSVPPPAPQAPAPAPAAPAGPGLVLYVGCIPVQGPHAGIARPLSVAWQPVADQICIEAQVPDIRLIRYAEGYGHLANRLRANPPQGVFYVYGTAGAVDAAALEALLPLADVIVQGTNR
jgi:hypothetical protein